MKSHVSHQSVMLREVIEALKISPEGIYVDATFGRGGHAREILSALSPQGQLYCLDKDPQAIAHGQECFSKDPRVHFYHGCFSDIARFAKEHGIEHKINGIMCDLGVSSPQLDEAHRGFSFRLDGPLDMRMDPLSGESASEWLAKASLDDITFVLKRYGEESYAKRIARKIVETREEHPLKTTSALAELVRECKPPSRNHKHPATQTFQAIRIHINQEMNALECMLKDALQILAPDGRLVVISFHSLEDRQVKRFFSSHSKVTLPRGLALMEKDLTPPPLEWVVKRSRPSLEELAVNPRSRSAVMRAAKKNPCVSDA